MSQSQSAFAAIQAKGGVTKSVQTDVAMATISAHESQSAIENKLKTLNAKGDTLDKMAESVGKEVRSIAGAASRKQTQESMGARDGIEYEEEKHKTDKINPFRKLAQSGIESQVEGGLGSISGGGGIHSLATQAGRQAYVQSASTAQDMKMKDETFGKGGFESAGLTMARKQSDDAIGSVKGIKHELTLHGDKGFQDVAQSGVQSQVEGGLGSIRGAGGINALATQAGTKAQSDSNALRATIATAGGAAGFIAMNQTLAIGNTQGQLAEIDQAVKEFGSYGKFKTTSARGSVSMAKAVFQGETAEDSVDENGNKVAAYRNKDGSYSKKGKEAVSAQKAKDSASALTGVEGLDKEGATAENKEFQEGYTKYTDETMIANKLAKKDLNGKVVPTTGLERAIAKGHMMGGDQYGMKGAAMLNNIGELDKVGMQTIINPITGKGVSNITSHARLTEAKTNQEAVGQNADSNEVKDQTKIFMSPQAALSHVAGWGYQAGVNGTKALGRSDEEAQSVGNTISVLAPTAAGLIALEGATSNNFVGMMRKDKDGTFMDKKGGGITLNAESGEYERTVMDKEGNPSVQSVHKDDLQKTGWVRGSGRNAWNGMKKGTWGLRDKLDGLGANSKESGDGTTDSSQKNHDHQPEKPVGQHQTNHDDSLKSDIHNSSTASQNAQAQNARSSNSN